MILTTCLNFANNAKPHSIVNFLIKIEVLKTLVKVDSHHGK